MKTAIRQGDVVLIPIKAFPKGARNQRKNGVLAYGEATGHSHAVEDMTTAFWAS